MLRKLASGVIPGAGATLQPAPGKTPVEGRSFAELLSQVKTGGVEKSAPVRLAKGSGIELSGEQLQRLGPAVDSADAGGANRLLALIDGKSVLIDVASRTVAGIASPSNSTVAGVDAVAVIPDAPAAALPAAAQGAGADAHSKEIAQTLHALPLPSAASIKNSSVLTLLSHAVAPRAA